MSIEPGQPGSRFTYQIEITAREKEAIERISQGVAVVGDMPLMDDVLRKIALLPKKVVAESKSEE